MKKMYKRLSAVLVAMLILLPVAGITTLASDGKNYIITNPYEDVDWDTWGAYKTQLHSHSNASDGYLTVHEYVQKHYDLNYDIVALTDHGTINKGWDKKPDTIPLLRYIKRERTRMAEIEPLTGEEYSSYLNGTAGSESRTHSNGMLDVPKGIELNMATPFADCHLTGYFSDYGQGLAGVFGDYETPAKGVSESGGISMLSHVGEYVYIEKDSAKHVGQPVDDYYAEKFARLFLDNKGSCVGMGINSSTDEHTRCDRILYDQVLRKTIPNGVVPWSFSFADSHNVTSINHAYTMHLMPELTMDNFRSSMENGQFFSVSHYSNGVELNGMAEMPGYNDDFESKDYNSDTTPMVTRISVNRENDTIYVEGVNFNMITWVSNGNVIRRETDISDGTAVLDLHSQLLDEPYVYVRFYLTGDNGICYSQPFVLNVEGEEFAPVKVGKVYDAPWFLRKLVTVLDVLVFRLNPIVWIFKYFGLGYNPVERLVKPY